MAGDRRPVGGEAVVVFLQQHLRIGLHRSQHPVFVVHGGEWFEQRCNGVVCGRCAVAAQRRQALADRALVQRRFRPPGGARPRPFRLQFDRVELRQQRRPAGAERRPVRVARLAALDQHLDARAHARIVRRAGEASRHCGCSEQAFGERIEAAPAVHRQPAACELQVGADCLHVALEGGDRRLQRAHRGEQVVLPARAPFGVADRGERMAGDAAFEPADRVGQRCHPARQLAQRVERFPVMYLRIGPGHRRGGCCICPRLRGDAAADRVVHREPVRIPAMQRIDQPVE